MYVSITIIVYVHFDSNINGLCAASQERERKWLDLGYLLLPDLWNIYDGNYHHRNITYSASLFHFWISIMWRTDKIWHWLSRTFLLLIYHEKIFFVTESFSPVSIPKDPIPSQKYRRFSSTFTFFSKLVHYKSIWSIYEFILDDCWKLRYFSESIVVKT